MLQFTSNSVCCRPGYWGEKGSVKCALTGVGVARLRLDGFQSLHAPLHSANGGPEPATATTRPLVFEGQARELNVDTGAGGSVVVAVTDCSGHALATSFPLVANDLAATVRWRDVPDLRRVEGRVGCLRFDLVGADVFAFQFVPS